MAVDVHGKGLSKNEGIKPVEGKGAKYKADKHGGEYVSNHGFSPGWLMIHSVKDFFTSYRV